MTKNKFDPGDLKVLEPSKAALTFASLLGHDLDYLRQLRKVASPFKWRVKLNLSDVDKALLGAVKANRALSPSKREDEKKRIIGVARQAAKDEWVRKRVEARQWIEMVRIFEGQVSRIEKLKEPDQVREAHEIRDAYYNKQRAQLARYADHASRAKADEKAQKAKNRAEGLAWKREREAARKQPTSAAYRYNNRRKMPASWVSPEKHYRDVVQAINRNDKRIATFKFGFNGQAITVTNPKPPSITD